MRNNNLTYQYNIEDFIKNDFIKVYGAENKYRISKQIFKKPIHKINVYFDYNETYKVLLPNRLIQDYNAFICEIEGVDIEYNKLVDGKYKTFRKPEILIKNVVLFDIFKSNF